MSVRNWINKVWCTHAIEYYAALRNNEEIPYIPIWSDLQNILFSDKSKMQDNV